MNNHPCDIAVRRGFRRAGAIPLLLVLSLSVSTFSAAALSAVPVEFQGVWVPSKARCDSPVRVQVAAEVLTLVNRNDSAAIGGIEMAGPGYFAPDYRGIMAVLITEFNGHQPVTATFNVGERRGAAQVEFAPVMPGKATAQLKAYNARISRLNLAKRFPLHQVPLKKCAR